MELMAINLQNVPLRTISTFNEASSALLNHFFLFLRGDKDIPDRHCLFVPLEDLVSCRSVNRTWNLLLEEELWARIRARMLPSIPKGPNLKMRCLEAFHNITRNFEAGYCRASFQDSGQVEGLASSLCTHHHYFYKIDEADRVRIHDGLTGRFEGIFPFGKSSYVNKPKISKTGMFIAVSNENSDPSIICVNLKDSKLRSEIRLPELVTGFELFHHFVACFNARHIFFMNTHSGLEEGLRISLAGLNISHVDQSAICGHKLILSGTRCLLIFDLKQRVFEAEIPLPDSVDNNHRLFSNGNILIVYNRGLYHLDLENLAWLPLTIDPEVERRALFFDHRRHLVEEGDGPRFFEVTFMIQGYIAVHTPDNHVRIYNTRKNAHVMSMYVLDGREFFFSMFADGKLLIRRSTLGWVNDIAITDFNGTPPVPEDPPHVPPEPAPSCFQFIADCISELYNGFCSLLSRIFP
jgi:hypothetical protein